MRGINGPVDIPKGMSLIEMSANNKVSMAQFQLGKLYEYGLKELPKDISKAIGWYTRAAENGHATAQYRLGKLYLKADTPLKNIPLGLEFLEKSASQNITSAIFNLGNIYYDGKIVKQDMAKALNYFQKGTGLGHLPSQNFVGFMIENGSGVKKDKEKACKIYDETGRRGSAYGLYRYGLCQLSDPDPSPENQKKAFILFEQAARKNLADAQYFLALCYEYGKGTPKNPGEAIEWYRRASENDKPEALYQLGML